MRYKQVVLASSNKGKFREIERIFPKNIQLLFIEDLKDISAKEFGITFIENAILKARYASSISKLPALADDSGLIVDYLSGAPGIHSAYYSGERDDLKNNIKLLKALKGVPKTRRIAHFICVLALVTHPDDPIPIITQGRWRGRILEKFTGIGGFGYDPLFWVPEYDCSASDLSIDQKNGISHRARAFSLLSSQLGL